jgi:hypothetical protein
MLGLYSAPRIDPYSVEAICCCPLTTSFDLDIAFHQGRNSLLDIVEEDFFVAPSVAENRERRNIRTKELP